MIGATHNGKFHADDVFGAVLLKKLFPEIVIVRTRDEAELVKADIVFDVGAVYDRARQRFDHHQQGAPKRPNGITYSAFGLLWHEFGLRYCGGNKEVWRRIDAELVQFIDARDNGDELYVLNDKNVEPYTVSDVLSLFNPLSNDESEDFDSQFVKAVELATRILDRQKAKIEDQLTSEAVFDRVYQQVSDKRFVVLDRYMSITGIAEKYPELLYVVFPAEVNKQWTLMTVRKHTGMFEARKPLPQAWASLRNEELARVTGVGDAVFCHTQRFVAAARSKEGTLSLLRLALDAPTQ